MKNKIFKIIATAALVLPLFVACENKDIIYPDFEYQTVYFATQYPVRTLVLGEDLIVDNAIDNEHKIEIKATTGGVYSNKNNIVIKYVVDENLCKDLLFDNSGTAVMALPSEYYDLLEDDIRIPAGSILGGVTVQLKDAFFADPITTQTNYVIPLRMVEVSGADSILQGHPLVDNPDLRNISDWETPPKNYTLYGVKYISQYHGVYLRRGLDKVVGPDTIANVSRKAEYIDYDEVVDGVKTLALNEISFPVRINFDNVVYNYELNLEFADDGTCIVKGETAVYKVEGTGKYIAKGEKKAIGDIDRDGLYLDYEVELFGPQLSIATKDTLVLRDRGVGPETFMVNINYP